ncbi:MAG: hypothetical protein JSR33_02935 [Proteobacteria bacterium]|nr:hypothetical protein [Pseudomonadota bacterium]
MFKEIESKTTLTGESLVHDFKAGLVTLKRETLGGQQSTLVPIIWKNKKYLIVLQRDPNIHSCIEAAELCQRLSDAKFQHPSVIKFIPIKAETGKLLIEQLNKMASKKDFVSSQLHKNLKSWRLYKGEICEIIADDPNAQIKLNYIEAVNICELVPGESLETKLKSDDQKISMIDKPLDEAYLSTAITHYQSIVEAVLHLNSIYGAHGDISGVNIIVDAMHNYTLIDMGCTIKANKNGVVTNIIGRDLAAPVYLAPELCVIGQETKPITVNKIDSWGLALILVQLLTKVIQPNIFNLRAGFPEDPKNYLTDRYSMHFDHKGTPLEIDKTYLSILSDSKLGNNIKTLLTKALKINPNNRLSVAEFILYLNYSPKRLDEIIVNNLSLAIVCNNLSMVEEFFRILNIEKNLLDSEANHFLSILNAVDNCEDIDVIGFTMQSLINCESFYRFLSKIADGATYYIRKLVDTLHCLESAKYAQHSQHKESLIKLVQELQLYYSDSFFASATLPVRQRAVKFAIIADNYKLLDQNIDVVDISNIINLIQLAIKYSNNSLKILIKRGLKLPLTQPFLHYMVVSDQSLLKHLLPHLPILETTDLNQKDSQENTLLHLAAQNFSDPVLFIYLVLLGGDFQLKNSSKKDCLSYLSESKQADSKIIIQFILLLTNKKSYFSFFSSSPSFSCKEPDEKTLFSFPSAGSSEDPLEIYSPYRKNLAKYIRDFIINEVNLNKTQGDRLSLRAVASNFGFYQISEIIFIALQALQQLERPDDTLTDIVKCFSCLELIKSLDSQFPLSPFIAKICDTYNSLMQHRSASAGRREAELFARSLMDCVRKKDGQSLKNLLKQCHCFGPNPLLIRKDGKEYTCAPLDYIVNALKTKNPWCINIGIESLLKKHAGIEDEDNVYGWYKLTRIECQIIYAMARQKGCDIGATRRSTNRLVRHLHPMNIDCNDQLTAICRDQDEGFYLSTTENEYKKIKVLIMPSMESWEKFGNEVMELFNKTFEIKNLKVSNEIKETTDLNPLITALRDCVYDALVKSDQEYLTNLEKLIKKVTIPKELNGVDQFLQGFLRSLAISNLFTKPEQFSSQGAGLKK